MKRGILMKKIAKFLASVKKEMAKVKWPSKKEMITYSVATLSFILFFMAFYTITDLVISGIKMLVA